MYSSISASLTAPSPIARRAEKPVPMPKLMRPGASPFKVAKALAVTAAMRFDGTSTPVPRRMREVLSAAAAIATKQSPVIICVSKNQAWVKPSSSARCANCRCRNPFAVSLTRGLYLQGGGEKPQHLRAGIGAKAARFLHRIDAPEMTRTRHHYRPHEEPGLLERGQELFRLLGGGDAVAFPALDQKEAHPGLFHPP